MTDLRPKIGVGVIVYKEGKILFGKRKNAHGDGTRSFPGGHLEFGEEVFDCAKREVLEETGLTIKNLRIGPYTNDIFDQENKHYITLFIISEYESGILEIKEPEKCDAWEWKGIGEILNNVFLPIQNLIKQGYDIFDLIK
ncbi:MAG: NUDIX hydrolase [Candidatus Absconditabacteria bacterium]|nr:NUDIX hydrolase [Candidatus Absconditabacteria bacterium]